MTPYQQFSYAAVMLALLGVLLLFSVAAHGSDRQLAGTVVQSSGLVSAQDENGGRPLSRRSPVYVGDTLLTSSDGFVQLRMIDSALVSLKANSIFEITEYIYEIQEVEDRATLKLIEGGFRTLSGHIGGAGYKVETPFATIGIRGTDHEAVITAEGLFTGVYQGGTRVENQAGSLRLGLDANFDYSHVRSSSSAPQGLLEQPAELGDINLPGNGTSRLIIETPDGAENSDNAASNSGNNSSSNQISNPGSLPQASVLDVSAAPVHAPTAAPQADSEPISSESLLACLPPFDPASVRNTFDRLDQSPGLRYRNGMFGLGY